MQPVSHSLSPRLHAFWLREHGIDGAYVPLAVAPEAFTAALDGIRAAGFVGINVTNPHKEAAFALADTNPTTRREWRVRQIFLFFMTASSGRATPTSQDWPQAFPKAWKPKRCTVKPL